MNVWRCMVCGERREIPPMQHVCAECASYFSGMDTRGTDAPQFRPPALSRPEFLAAVAGELVASVAALKRWTP